MRCSTRFRSAIAILALTGILGGITTAPASAQKAAAVPTLPPQPAPGEVFRQVFGVDVPVTGKNGNEDLVLAVEALKSSKLFTEAEARLDKLTLADRRGVLGDRAVQKALALTRRAVTKPVLSPRTTLTFETTLPELGGFRSLARLLGMLQYVQLADGRTTDAIGTARLCLRMGQVVQTDTLISALVGIAIEALCVRALADHLDQLSARDCALLFDVCREWLAQPPPGEAIWQAELSSADQFTTALRAAGPEGAPEVMRRMLGLDDKQMEEMRGRLRGLTPETLNSLSTQTSKEMHGYYSRAVEELRKPAWLRNRSLLRPDTTGSLAWLTNQMMAPLDRIGDAYTREQSQVRLLACHAAILRYRWEKNALPPNLAALNLGDLAIDPFTGQPLQYRPRRRQYRLFSAGAPAEADDPQAVDGRRPVSLTPEE